MGIPFKPSPNVLAYAQININKDGRRTVWVTNGHGVAQLARPRHDFETLVMKRMKSIVNRHD